MVVKVRSVAHLGLETVPVEVEVDVASRGFPSFTVVGLPSKAVDEAKERVKTAIVNSGASFPNKKITVNLAPADLPKEGSCYDLPMAVGILAASGEVTWDKLDSEAVYYGELSLEGRLRHTKGVLLTALWCRKETVRMFVPDDSVAESSVVEGVESFGVRDLKVLVSHWRKEKRLRPVKTVFVHKLVNNPITEVDFSEVVGQESAKRALEIAAAGGHNILMSGSPGSGKTMLARAVASILPPMNSEEALEVTRVYSASGLMKPGEAIRRVRPFRSPHHSTSLVGLVGGGSKPQPGEISLAHLGVMFLDEMAEFSRSAMEALRQPLEDGKVVISRAMGRVEYPAEFMLVGAVNPCPCGYLGHYKKRCKCTQREIERYKRKLSGPILDRIDLHIEVPAVDPEKLGGAGGESSSEVRKRVVKAREVQRERGVFCNAQLNNRQIKRWVKLDKKTKRMLMLAVEKYDISARGYYRLLKVARTIADLAGVGEVASEHLAEALQYRMRVS